MMRGKSGLFGANKAKAKLEKISADVEKQLKNTVAGTAFNMQGEAKTLIQRGPKTGKLYGKHIASKAGEAPASDTGILASSIQVQFEKQDLAARIGTHLKYGKFLELGTKDIEPRPFLFPAYKKFEQKFKDKIIEIMIKATKKQGA